MSYPYITGIVTCVWVSQTTLQVVLGFSSGAIVMTEIDKSTGMPSEKLTKYIIHSTGEEVKCLNANEDLHILVSVAGCTIRIHSLNDGSTLNYITLTKICKNILGIQLSKNGYFAI